MYHYINTIPHFDSVLVFLASQVALKDVGDVLFLGKLLPPHGPQTLRLPPATQVKQVIVLELPKGWRGRVAPATVRKVIPCLSSVDVAFWTHGPEDWTHVLRVATVIGWWFPWQRLEGEWVLTPHAKSLEDLRCGNLSVQSVEMKTLDLYVEKSEGGEEERRGEEREREREIKDRK